MNIIKAKYVNIDGDNLFIFTSFRKFSLQRDNVDSFRIGRISSLFDEIGIELRCSSIFLISERVSGFFDLAKFLRLEDAFGPSWYRDAEDGRQLDKTCKSEHHGRSGGV